jgi:hypothetical protein
LEIGITAALPLEKFFPSDPLAVAAVANLQPACVTLQIGIKLPLGDDPFEVLLAGKLEKSLSMVLNMIAVQEPLTPRRNERAQSLLAVDQW